MDGSFLEESGRNVLDRDRISGNRRRVRKKLGKYRADRRGSPSLKFFISLNVYVILLDMKLW